MEKMSKQEAKFWKYVNVFIADQETVDMVLEIVKLGGEPKEALRVYLEATRQAKALQGV